MSALDDILRLSRFRLDKEGRALSDANRASARAMNTARLTARKAHESQQRIGMVREAGYQSLIGKPLHRADRATIDHSVSIARELAREDTAQFTTARDALERINLERDSVRTRFLAAQARVERLEAYMRENRLKAIRNAEWREEADL